MAPRTARWPATVNITPDPKQPYVGTSAFAHKAGLHTSAIARAPDAYSHITPDAVGNGTRFVVSELSGRSTVQLKAAELGLQDPPRRQGHGRDRSITTRNRHRVEYEADIVQRDVLQLDQRAPTPGLPGRTVRHLLRQVQLQDGSRRRHPAIRQIPG